MKPQYCPECFGNTLRLKKSGIFEVVINGIPMDAGKILYNLEKDHSEVKDDLTKKVRTFFQYYSRFSNKKPIHSIKLTSRDFVCTNGCAIARYTFPIVGILFTAEEVMTILKEEAEKHPLKLELEQKDIT